MFGLAGKRALVTGSTQGIGFAIAKCLHDHGAKVLVHGSTNIEKAANAAAKMNGSIPVVADLSQEGCIEKLIEQTGEVDILVLNASVQYRKAWHDITSEEFDEQVRVNLKSSLQEIQAYVPHMIKKKWGRIVTVGSVQQYKPHENMLIYAATKAAQMNMVTNLAKQLAPFGITVNNMAPGVINTARNEDALKDKEYKNKIINGIPCRCIGTAEDCAGGALL